MPRRQDIRSSGRNSRMTRITCALVFLLLQVAVASAKDPAGNTLDSRIWEVLAGPPQGIPRPKIRTVLMLCQGSGVSYVDLRLLRLTGTTDPRLMGVQRRVAAWISFLKNATVLYPDHLVSFVLDLSCRKALDILSMANKLNLYRSPYRWLLISPSWNETSMSMEECATMAKDILRDYEIFLNSEVLFMCRFGKDGQSGLLIEWYRYHMPNFDKHTFMGDLASWEADARINWTERSYQPMAVRRRNLRNMPLKIGFLFRSKDTLNHLDDGYDTRTDTMTKYFWPILKNTAHMLNATMVDKWTQSWGFPKNGTWSGLTGMLQTGEVEISGLPMLNDKHRSAILSYTNFYGPSAGIFLFRAPPMTFEANLFVLPFPDTLWAAAGGLVCICVFLLYLVLWTEDTIDQEEPADLALLPKAAPVKSAKPKAILASSSEEEDNVEGPKVEAKGDGIQAKARLHGSWSDVILLVFGAVCQQGSPAEARTIPGRIVTIFLLISLMFLFTSYSASIVVLLQSTSNSIVTLEDLWKSRLPCGAEDQTYVKMFFSQAEGEARHGIVQKVLRKNKHTKSGNNYMSLESGVDRARKDYFAFHALKTSMYPIISDTWQEHEKCALREVYNMVYPQNPDCSARRNSPVLEMLKITLRKMHERGHRVREIWRLIPSKPPCTKPGSNFVSVSVMDCYFAMVILTSGICASLLVLGFEHMAVRRPAMVAAQVHATAARTRSLFASKK